MKKNEYVLFMVVIGLLFIIIIGCEMNSRGAQLFQNGPLQGVSHHQWERRVRRTKFNRLSAADVPVNILSSRSKIRNLTTLTATCLLSVKCRSRTSTTWLIIFRI